ncbi:MAG: hypothetical protein WCO42_12020, partial [bacterium]
PSREVKTSPLIWEMGEIQAKGKRECFAIFMPGEYTSHKNRETTFPGIEDTRERAERNWSGLLISSDSIKEPLRDFWFGYSRIKMPQHYFLLLWISLISSISGEVFILTWLVDLV